MLKQQLEDIYARPFNHANATVEAHLLTRLHDLWNRDEMHWKQYSTIQWLQESDHNTRFFYFSVISRHHFNHINRIQSSSREWIEEEAALHSYIRNFFSHLYSASSLQGFDLVLNLIPPLVTPVVNDALLARLSDSEVFQVVFQLGGEKAPGLDGFSSLFYQHH